jgi:hypothetical protein
MVEMVEMVGMVGVSEEILNGSIDEEILNDFIDKEILDEKNKIYYQFLINIKNYVILSSDDMYYIKTLSKDNLIEIINIYNLHIINITTAFANA